MVFEMALKVRMMLVDMLMSVVWGSMCWVGCDGYGADCLYVGAGVASAYYFGW